MRDILVTEEQYFVDFIDTHKNLISGTNSNIKSGKILDQNLPRARHLSFVSSLGMLISSYSKGDSLNAIKTEYASTLNYMANGWDDIIVKFKKGRPQVIYDKYMLNEYCYMIWMLSLAVLLRVSDKEVNTLKTLIENGKISDELIILLMSFLTNSQSSKEISKTTYKPFSGIIKGEKMIDTEKQMKNYLDKWYQNTKLLMWHNYNPEIGKYYYYGRWSFEAAAVTCIMNLDDSNYRDNQYYPKDLVDYYRSKK